MNQEAIDTIVYDVLVVGGGHAGCEAALACARLGHLTLLVTGNLDRIAAMSCNPAIGGVGKGHLVKEIDALGGEMAKIADETGIHFRTLNESRGPAVRATRCQSDMNRYQRAMTQVVLNTPNLRLRQDDVTGLFIQDDGSVGGVFTKLSGKLRARRIILTTGTFLGGELHFGANKTPGGRAGEAPTRGLSDSMQKIGLEMGRLKTGTCPRLDGRTIRNELLEEQLPDTPAPRFSFESGQPELPQVSCFLTHTNTQTHGIIADAVHSGIAPLFNGQLNSTGPRYCPSIEDKVVRFSDKESHLIFLEPHGLDTYEVYPNGLSTSLPPLAQLRFLRSIRGLEEVEVTRWGYAVEYDFVKPTELFASLETKKVKNLFCAGQINGTTGYEEAAVQGLLAGINASMSLQGKKPVVLPRHLAYAGVLIDDLVTLGTEEPYRMFTSRAEHRLLLREDNVYFRLMDIGAETGLLETARHQRMKAFEQAVADDIAAMRTTRIKPPGEDGSITVAAWVKRPEVNGADAHDKIRFRAVVELKYEGYIDRAQKSIEREKDLEDAAIPAHIFETQLSGVSNEIFEKLRRIRPLTLGQASRISGMTPAAISLLAVAIKREYESNRSK